MSFKTMNRKARRKEDKVKIAKDYLYLQGLKKETKEQIAEEAALKSFKLMLGFPLLALRDNFGFGSKRLEKFTAALLELYEAYAQGYLEIEDINKTILEETGIKIEREFNGERR